MAETLLGYTGNAGLASGSNADIPVTSNKDLDVINQTSRDIYLNGLQRNQQIFQQKLKDRDQLLQAIDSGDLKVGDVLEQDTPYVKEGLDSLDRAWADRIKRGVNDIDAQLAYKKALRDAQDRVTQAQARKVFYDGESGALGKETLLRKQKARKQNLDSVIGGGFWKDLTPYQQTQDLDFDPINAYVKPVTTEYTDPANPLLKGKRTTIDYNQVRGLSEKDFLENNDIRQDQIGLFESFQNMPPEKSIPALQAIQRRLQEYNKQRGFAPADQGYLQLKVATNPDGSPILSPDGRPVINESVPDFAAKWALANQPNYVTQSTDFDKDRASFELGKERNRISAANAGANQLRARTYAALQNKKLANMDEAEKRVMAIWPKIIDKVKTTKRDTGAPVDVVWAGDLPRGYTNINGLDAKGQPITLTPFKGKKGEEYFENRYYSGDGQQIDLRAQFEEFKTRGGKGSYDDLRKRLLREGKINLEIAGQNGSADINSALETARALNNKIGAANEPPVYQESSVEINDQ